MSSAHDVDGLEPLTNEEKLRTKRQTLVVNRSDNPIQKFSIYADTYLAEQYDQINSKLEWQILKETQEIDAPAFNRLRTIPEIGKTSGLVILYEVDTIEPFKTVKIWWSSSLETCFFKDERHHFFCLHLPKRG